jgi:hypothetical protein
LLTWIQNSHKILIAKQVLSTNFFQGKRKGNFLDSFKKSLKLSFFYWLHHLMRLSSLHLNSEAALIHKFTAQIKVNNNDSLKSLRKMISMPKGLEILKLQSLAIANVSTVKLTRKNTLTFSVWHQNLGLGYPHYMVSLSTHHSDTWVQMYKRILNPKFYTPLSCIDNLQWGQFNDHRIQGATPS